MTPQQEIAAARAAIAHGDSLTALPFTLAALAARPGGPRKEEAHSLIGEAVNWAGKRSMRPRKARNAGQFIPRKTARAFRAVLPAWMLPLFGAALAIPGPVDDGVLGLVALVLIVARFPRARSAWRGGKTHRKAAGR